MSWCREGSNDEASALKVASPSEELPPAAAVNGAAKAQMRRAGCAGDGFFSFRGFDRPKSRTRSAYELFEIR